MTSQAALSISLSSSSSIAIIRTISRLVYEHCLSIKLNDDTAACFQLAAQELAENVVKYSAGPQVKLEVELSKVGHQRWLCVRASNEASSEQLHEAERRLVQIIEAEDPIALYDRMIRESAPQLDVSGLGLVRLRAEAEFVLEYKIEGRLLTISAFMDVAQREVG
jgi:two-component sensor histidine kinase